MYSFGTDEYISRVVETHSGSMLRAAYSILRSTADAEDAVQEAFVRLMTKAPKLRDSEHEKAWLLRVTINIARNIKKAKSRSNLPLDTAIAGEKSEEVELKDLVHSLPERYATVIHLYYYEGYSILEIAEILKIPSATVGTRLSRGRSMLKSMLKEEDCK